MQSWRASPPAPDVDPRPDAAPRGGATPPTARKREPCRRDLEAEKIKLLQNKQIQALTSNLGKLEGKVSEMTRKYEELQKKDAMKAKLEKEKEQKAHVIA